MRYLIRLLLVVFVLMVTVSVYAQDTETQTATTQVQTFSFATLTNFVDETLRGPYATLRYRFSLPDNWTLNTTIEARLFISAISTTQQNTANVLQVYFNNVYIDTFAVDTTGEHILSFSVPQTALISYLGNNRHELYLVFDARQECESGEESLLILNNNSTFTFNYDETPLTLDLRALPRPIYQNTYEEQTALLVIPDTPSASVLQSALITSAAFGRMSGTSLKLRLVRHSELTDVQRNTQHLLYVGLPDSFPELAELDLPLPVVSGQFDAAVVMPDDGVLQMIENPNQPQRALLLVSGSSDAGVVKAAVALSYGQVLVYDIPNLAIVESTEILQRQPVNDSEQVSFADMGYEARVVTSQVSTEYYRFYLPSVKQISDEAMLNLAISHSLLMDFDRSGISVRLNGAPIDSIVLSEATAELSLHSMPLPPTSLVAGMNEIAIDVDLRARSQCFEDINRQLWLNIDAMSHLSLPVAETNTETIPVTNLSEFPNPFDFEPNLQTTHLVLEAEAPETWDSAVQLAAFLGNRVLVPGVFLDVSFDNDVSEAALAANHVIIMGHRDSHLLVPVLDNLLEEQNGSRISVSQAPLIGYRLSDGDDTAYLQFMVSPWNADYSVLAIFSPKVSGLQNAINALTTFDIRRTLLGNFALLQNNTVIVNTIEFVSTSSGNLGFEVREEAYTTLVLDNRTRLIIFISVATSVLVIVLVVVGSMRLLQRRSQPDNAPDK